LGHPDEYDAIPHRPLLPEVVGDIVFPFLVVELVNRYAFLFREHFDRLPESLRYLSQHHWGRNRLPQLVTHEHRQPQPSCELAYVAVEVQAVKALHFQRDVPIKEFWNRGHSRILCQSRAIRSSV